MIKYYSQGKQYIGKVEALEMALVRGIDKLPIKGKEILTVNSYHPETLILGNDEEGFYLESAVIEFN